jgi:hypothetical protein
VINFVLSVINFVLVLSFNTDAIMLLCFLTMFSTSWHCFFLQKCHHITIISWRCKCMFLCFWFRVL